jgi:hypothetical protein
MAVASPTIATKQAGQAAVVHTLNLRLFEAIFRQFADSANFSAIPDEEMQDSHDMTTGLKLDWDGHGGAVEMEAYGARGSLHPPRFVLTGVSLCTVCSSPRHEAEERRGSDRTGPQSAGGA